MEIHPYYATPAFELP